MKNSIVFFLSALFSLAGATAQAEIPKNLKCLWVAYPVFKIIEKSETVLFPDGTQIPYPDHSGLDPRKDFDQIVENVTSLEQMFLIPYQAGFQKNQVGQYIVRAPGLNEDPGRLRYEAFFKKIYGETPTAARSNQVWVNWAVDNSKWLFNKKFGAAQALEKVSVELLKLTHAHPALLQYVTSPLGGTFNWRPIAGSHNMSVHSFGVAIDINPSKTDYWRWDISKSPNQAPKFRNRIPAEIAEVFESNGFIWGGKWSHYDTMHFEYRPELLISKEYCELKFNENYQK
jgi:hypothetical protein